MRNHITPIRITRRKKKQTIKHVHEEVEKLEPSYTSDENVKWCSHLGKYSDSSLKC